jgi:acyl-CoA synthetase (NDP forming)
MANAVEEYQTLLSNGIPVYSDPGRAAKALAKLSGYAEFKRSLKES